MTAIPFFPPQHDRRRSVAALRAALIGRSETLFDSVLGRRLPGSNARVGRYAVPGGWKADKALVDYSTGRFWIPEESDAGTLPVRQGDLLDLALWATGHRDLRSADAWVAVEEWAGTTTVNPAAERAAHDRREADARREADRKRKQAARLLGSASTGAGRSAVVDYLAGRGISLPADADVITADRLNYFDETGRKLTAAPAMIWPMRPTDRGHAAPCGAHVTYIRDGRKADFGVDATGKRRPSKKMVGKAAPIRVTGRWDAATWGVAEGVETALSAIAAGFAGTVFAAGSAHGVGEFHIPDHIRHLTVFADRGKVGEAAARKLAARASEQGVETWIVWPSDSKLVDLNDAWRAALAAGTANGFLDRLGRERVRPAGASDPIGPSPAEQLAAARADVDRAAEAFFATVAGEEAAPEDAKERSEFFASRSALRTLVKAPTGVSKTAAFVQTAAAWAVSRPRWEAPGVLIWAVPNGNLQDEAVERLRAAVIGRGGSPSLVMALTGRERGCIRGPETVKQMGEARRLGVDVGATFCRSGQVYCPMFDTCPVMREIQRIRDADRGLDTVRVAVVTHSMLVTGDVRLPSDVRGVVIDEDPIGAFLSGESTHSADDLRLASAWAVEDAADAETVARMRAFELLALVAGSTQPKARLSIEPWHAVQLDEARKAVETIIDAIGADVHVSPAMSPAERAAAFQALEKGRRWRRLANLADAVMSGAAVRAPGERVTVSVMRRRDLAPALAGRPIAVLDATADLTILSHILPGIEAAPIADVAEDPAFVRNVLVTPGMASAVSLSRLTGTDPRFRERARRLVEDAARQHGKGLAVAPKQAVATGFLDGIPGVEVRHYGSLVGLDAFKDVGAVVLIGSNAAPVWPIERAAMALAGTDVHAEPADVVTFRKGLSRAVKLRDGRTSVVPGFHHPDPLVEALRRRAHEGELLQAAGRGRGLLRPATGKPLTVIWFTDSPPESVVFDEVVSVGASPASAAYDVAVLAGGFPIGRPGVAALLAPGVFASEAEAWKYAEHHGWPAVPPAGAQALEARDGREVWTWVETAGRSASEVAAYLASAGVQATVSDLTGAASSPPNKRNPMIGGTGRPTGQIAGQIAVTPDKPPTTEEALVSIAKSVGVAVASLSVLRAMGAPVDGLVQQRVADLNSEEALRPIARAAGLEIVEVEMKAARGRSDGTKLYGLASVGEADVLALVPGARAVALLVDPATVESAVSGPGPIGVEGPAVVPFRAGRAHVETQPKPPDRAAA